MSYQMTLQDSPRYLSGEYDYEVVGGDTIYYHNYPDVSSTNNLGSVASGGFLARAAPSWVVSAGTSYIAQRERSGTTDPSLVEPEHGAGSFYNAATRTFEMRPVSDPPITWQGAWDSETTYSIHDAVTKDGSSYISLSNFNTNEPGTSNDESATEFDGVDDYITTDGYDPFDDDGAVTISGWIKRGDGYPDELYMPTPTALDKWKAVREDQRALTTQAHVSVIGDSIAFGAAATGASLPKYENCWPGQLRALIDARFSSGGVGAGTGLVLADENLRANPTWDDRWTWSAGITDYGSGLYRKSCYRMDGASADEITFTATCQQFRIMVLSDSGGQMIAKVDGGADILLRNIKTGTLPDIEIESGNHPNILETVIPAGALGEHTLTLLPPTSSSDHDTFLCWVEGQTTTNGSVRISNLSNNGESLSTLGAYTSGVNNDETNGSYGLPHLDAAKADLMIIALGINDWQGATSVSTIKDALTNLIVRQRSSGTASGGGDHADGDVMLLWNPIPNIAALGKSESLWEDYRQAYYEVADEQNCALLDLGLVWDDYATGSGLGYYADTIHLSDSGSAIVAQKVAQSIFGSDVNEYLAAGDTTSAPTVAINWFSDDFGIRTDISESNSYVTWNSACPDPGEWFHYSVVMDAGNDLAYLYINGTRVSVKPMTYDYGTPGNLQLGARKDGIGPYEGSMQGFSVHERVLTASEIADAVAADNYESTMRGYSGLSMYLPLCEDNGLNDLSGLSNHGSENGGMTIGGDTSEAPAPGRDSLWSIVAARGLQGESNSITVEDYGAVGDGVQDDTFAIQSAIDAAGTAGGGTVLLTPGHTYVISDTLSGVANLHIVGYGATIELTTTSNIDALVFDTVDNVRVTGVTIDGIKSTKTSDTDTGRGIYILQADNVTIEDCYIHDCYEDGVRVGGLVTTHDDQDTTNVRIINNRFDSCGNDAHHAGFGVKLYWRVKDSVISGNLIEACDAGGICVDDVGSGADTGKECYGITVANNVLTDNGTTPANTASIGIKVQGSLEWSISNNVITGSYRGISVGIGEASASTGRATIDANKIEAVYMGIRLQDTEDIAITGNQITVTGSTTAYEGGVVLEETAAAAPNLSRISIVGNNIVSNATGINSRLSTNYAGATGVLIADNSLHCTEGTPGGTDNGMNLYYLDDLHVVGNHVDGHYAGIFPESNCTNVVISSNVVTNCTYYGIQIGCPALVTNNLTVNSTLGGYNFQAGSQVAATHIWGNVATEATKLAGATTNTVLSANNFSDWSAGVSGGKIGFYGTAPGAKPTVTGAHGSNAALQSLLTALAGLGLITDSSS